MLVELSSITLAKEKFDELLIVSLLITSTELPTVLNYCRDFPGDMTIIGISWAKRLFGNRTKNNIILTMFFSISI